MRNGASLAVTAAHLAASIRHTDVPERAIAGNPLSIGHLMTTTPATDVTRVPNYSIAIGDTRPRPPPLDK